MKVQSMTRGRTPPRGTCTRSAPGPTATPRSKPVDLMRHLIRLVTPPGGTVLDPFLGSGTTAVAAEMEGFDWIGIERDPAYVEIARARLTGIERGLGLDVPAPKPASKASPKAERVTRGRAPTASMFEEEPA